MREWEFCSIGHTWDVVCQHAVHEYNVAIYVCRGIPGGKFVYLWLNCAIVGKCSQHSC